MTDFNNFNYREINATQSNFIGFVSNGKIYNSFNQQIGVTNEEYKKAIDILIIIHRISRLIHTLNLPAIF